MLTLNQIRSTFQTIANAHKQLNGFGFDNEANFGQSDDMQYPCLYVVQQPANISNGVISRTFDLFVLDRYYGDSDGNASNITDVLSDTQLIAADVVSLLNNTEYEFQLDKNTVTIEPVYAEKDDLLAGYKATVTLREGFDYWRCSVPYDFIVIEQVNGLQETSTNEKDPTVPTYVKAITEANIQAWNNAYPNNNPSGFITSGQAASTYYPRTNPSGFLTAETDPTVPAIIKAMPTSGSAAPVGWNGSAYILLPRSGTWANRPNSPFVGQVYFATDLGTSGALLTWNGTSWKGQIIYKNNAATGVGNTTANTIARSYLIPAGVATIDMVIDVRAYVVATATQVYSIRIYIDSTASGTTNLISQNLNVAANQTQGGITKRLFNNGSLTAQRSYLTTTGAFSLEQTTSSNPANTLFAVNTANDFYINFALQKGASGDAINFNLTELIINL